MEWSEPQSLDKVGKFAVSNFNRYSLYFCPNELVPAQKLAQDLGRLLSSTPILNVG